MKIHGDAIVCSNYQAQSRNMSNDVKQESHGSQSPNISTRGGAVSIIYNNWKMAVGAIVLVLAVVVVFIWWNTREQTEVLGTKTDELGTKTDALVTTTTELVTTTNELSKKFDDLMIGNLKVTDPKVLGQGEIEPFVARANELLIEMKLQVEGIEGYEHKDVVLELLNADTLTEKMLGDAEEILMDSFLGYIESDTNPETRQRAATEAFIIGAIGTLKFDYDLARDYYGEATALDPENSLYWTELGSLELTFAQTDEAIRHFEQALSLRIDLNEKGCPSADALDAMSLVASDPVASALVASSLNDLGTAWYRKKNYFGAIDCYEQTLSLRVGLRDQLDPDIEAELAVAAVYNNVGMVYDHIGDNEIARDMYYQEALDIYEELEHEDWEYANTLHNMGVSWYESQKYKRANNRFLDSLKFRLKDLGGEHPDVASNLESLGLTSLALGEKEEAIKYYRDSIPIYQKSLGTKHPRTVKAKERLKRAQQE